MVHHQVHIIDGGGAKDTLKRIVHVERFPYIVVHPIFKNGKEHQPGDIILLDKATANRFIENGDLRQ